MTNEPAPDDLPPVVKSTSGRVNSTLYLGPPVRGNATAEELTWPVVQLVRRVNSTLLDEPPVRGNATAEELTWPVVPSGGGIISVSRPVPAPVADPAKTPESPLPESQAVRSSSRSEKGVSAVLESHLQSVVHDVAALIATLPQGDQETALRLILAAIQAEVAAHNAAFETAITEAALGLRLATSAEQSAT